MHSHLSALGPVYLELVWIPCILCQFNVHQSIVYEIQGFLGVIHPLWLVFFLPLLPHSSLSPKGTLTKTSRLGLTVTASLTLHILSVVQR